MKGSEYLWQNDFVAKIIFRHTRKHEKYLNNLKQIQRFVINVISSLVFLLYMFSVKGAKNG